MSSPKIAIFLGTHGRGYGAERVLEHLLEASPADIAAVICPSSATAAETARQAGIEVIPWESPTNSTAGNLIAYSRFRPAKKTVAGWDALHAWHTRGFEWGCGLGRRFHLPVFGTLHDDPTSPQNSPVRRWLIRKGAHGLRALATVSQALDRICAKEGWQVPRAVIPNGLPDQDAPRTASASSRLRVAFLGLNELWKGLDCVEKIARAFSHGEVEWHFFGDPCAANLPILHRLECEYPGLVHRRGRQPPRDIYTSVDAVLHPSQRFDPYPTVLLECARAGIPAIASNAGGSQEIIVDGETGRLLAPNDVDGFGRALRLLQNDPVLRSRLGLGARQRYLAHFQVKTMVQGYRSLWRSHLS